MSTKRPWWCQDPACTPTHNNAQPADEPGWGGFCCGQVEGRRVDVLHGITHDNDGHFCIRSPRSGVSMFNVREVDWLVLGEMALIALASAGEAGCVRALGAKAGALVTPETKGRDG